MDVPLQAKPKKPKKKSIKNFKLEKYLSNLKIKIKNGIVLKFD